MIYRIVEHEDGTLVISKCDRLSKRVVESVRIVDQDWVARLLGALDRAIPAGSRVRRRRVVMQFTDYSIFDEVEHETVKDEALQEQALRVS